LQGTGYDVGSKFARGGISLAAVSVVRLTVDKMEAEWAELIAIILNVAKMMQHIFRCINKSETSIDERLKHELETNRRNNEEERGHERMLYRKKRAYFLLRLKNN
jgi:hypothetical protein